MQNKNKIKRLVKHNCASYLGDKHGISNYCCLKDGSCAFINHETSLTRFQYFEDSVLPIDQNLEHEYKMDRNMEVERQIAKPKVNCKKCGDTFEANSNRQHYCEKCRKRNKKEKTKLRVRKLRQK